MKSGCHSFLERLTTFLTWIEMAFFEHCTGRSLLFFSRKKKIPAKSGLPKQDLLDWNFTRNLTGQAAWNELSTVVLLSTTPTEPRNHLGPSRLLAKLRSETVGSSEIEVKTVVFNPQHPVVIVIYDDDNGQPCLSAQNFRPHSIKLKGEILFKKFDHTGYLTASWSPDGQYLIAQSICWENRLKLFRYDADSISMYELSNWNLKVRPGLHSSQLWTDSKSFIAYGEPIEDLRLHTLTRKGLKMRIRTLRPASKGLKSRGHLKVLSNRFSCESSQCQHLLEGSTACHSRLHLMTGKRLDAALTLNLPGVLIDVAGKNDKCYILWRTRIDSAWESRLPTATSSSDPDQNACPLGNAVEKTAGSDRRVELTVLDLKTLTMTLRSTVVDGYSTIWISECQRGGPMRWNEELSVSQSKISFTENLLVIDPEEWGRHDSTFVMHLRHRLSREPLRLLNKTFFHPLKNAHAVANGPGYNVSIFENRLCFPNFERPLKSRSPPSNSEYWCCRTDSSDYDG